MSETLKIAYDSPYDTDTSGYEPEDLAAEASATESKIKDPTWGDMLHNIVAVNADVVVVCPWMGGTEATLGTAMTTYNYPPNLTAADEFSVIEVVNDLLACRPEEDKDAQDEAPTEELFDGGEETSEEEEKGDIKKDVDKKGNTPTEDNEAQTEQAAVIKERPSKKIDGKTEKKPLVEAAQKAPEPKGGLPNAAATATPPKDRQRPEQLAKNIVKAGVVNKISDRPKDLPAASPEAPPAADDPVGELGQRPGIDMARVIRTVQSVDVVASKKNEPKEQTLSLETAEIADGIELTEAEAAFLASEASGLGDGNVELISQAIDPPEKPLAIDIGEQQIGTLSAPDFIETEPLFAGEGSVDEVVLFAPPLGSRHDNQPEAAEEFTVMEQFGQISLPATEDGAPSLVPLEEHIEDGDLEKAEAVNEVLDKIVAAPAKFEADSGDSIAGVEAQEELEELFTELLEAAGIEPTPELVESLAPQRLRWSPAERIEKLKIRVEDETPQDIGTREAIMQMLIGTRDDENSLALLGTLGEYAIAHSFSLVS